MCIMSRLRLPFGRTTEQVPVDYADFMQHDTFTRSALGMVQANGIPSTPSPDIYGQPTQYRLIDFDSTLYEAGRKQTIQDLFNLATTIPAVETTNGWYEQQTIKPEDLEDLKNRAALVAAAGHMVRGLSGCEFIPTSLDSNRPRTESGAVDWDGVREIADGLDPRELVVEEGIDLRVGNLVASSMYELRVIGPENYIALKRDEKAPLDLPNSIARGEQPRTSVGIVYGEGGWKTWLETEEERDAEYDEGEDDASIGFVLRGDNFDTGEYSNPGSILYTDVGISAFHARYPEANQEHIDTAITFMHQAPQMLEEQARTAYLESLGL